MGAKALINSHPKKFGKGGRRCRVCGNQQALINSHPKKFGKGGRRCRVCGNQQAIIRKYNMNICRQCFRTYAKDIGFVKYN